MSTADRLRVVHVVPDLGVGGAERHAATLMSHLDRRTFAPSLVCIGRRGELFDTLDPAVHAVALGRTKRQALKTVLDLVRLFRELSPDLVIVRGFNAELLGRVAAVLARVRHTVVWVHNCGDVAPRGTLRHVLDRALDPVTDAYFGVAHAQVPYIVEQLGLPESKVRIIHNGVDTEAMRVEDSSVRHELGLDDEHQVVGTLAALRPEEDLETFLHAAARVAGHHPRARFLVVGDGPRRTTLENLARELGLEHRVVFMGQRTDVAAVLSAMDVFVLTSYTVECFPMALLEAMACSTAAVCTAVGGIPEIVDEGVTGYLVSPKDPVALAERLADLLRSPDKMKRFGSAGGARVQARFTLRASVLEAERQMLAVAGRSHDGSRQPVRLALVLDETHIGGIELLMLHIFKSFDPHTVVPRLILLRKLGPIGEDFRAAGIDVEVLGHSGRFDVRTLPRLVRSLRRKKADVVLVTHHHRASLFFGRLAAGLAAVRHTVVAVHDMDLTSVGGRCLPRSTVSTLCLSTALVLLTPRQGEYLHREEGVGRHPWSRTRETVIPNGIVVPPLPGPGARNSARVELGLDDDDFVVGIVARLSAQKAHHVLLEAFNLLLRSHPRARLVVVGGGEREGELHELASGLGIAASVRFTGIRRDVQALLPAFDVACLSSVHEGVPITVIEAMAAALPVVATDCGSLPDMITDGDQGFIVPVGDSAALAARLTTLAEDPELRRRQGDAARDRVEKRYSIVETTRGYEELLVSLVDAR